MRLLLAALLLLGGAAPVRAAAADTEAPRLESVAFSRERITVSGLAVELLTITAHVTDETGVDETGTTDRLPGPYIATRGGGASLTLGRGTPRDGWYTGGLAITSSYSGDYRPTGYGSDRPRVQLLFAPDPANPGDAIERTVRVTDAAGQPLANVPVQIRDDNQCAEDLGPAPDGRTDASGRYAGRPPAGGNGTYEYGMCALINTEFNVPEQRPTFLAAVNTRPRYYRAAAISPGFTIRGTAAGALPDSGERGR